jgi:DNA-binding transcriptional LysR family regulator
MTNKNRKNILHISASYTIGTYILPGEYINYIVSLTKSKMKLNINSCTNIIDGIKSGEFDLGFIESPIFDDELTYREWEGDELMLCSKTKLPNYLNRELLSHYKLISREESSPTRILIDNFLKQFNLSSKSFKSLSEINNTTALIQSVKWSKPNSENPTVAIVSNLAIEDEVKYNELFQSRIYGNPLERKFYIVTSKKNDNNPLILDILQGFLTEKRQAS